MNANVIHTLCTIARVYHVLNIRNTSDNSTTELFTEKRWKICADYYVEYQNSRFSVSTVNFIDTCG